MAKNRNSIIASLTRTATKLRDNAKQRENLRWVLAGQSYDLRGTYPAGGEKAALAAAATATGFSEGDIASLIRAFETRTGLTDAQKKRVETWTTDAMLTLRGKGMDTKKQTRLIDWAEKQQTQNVKKLRDQKKKIVGGQTRNRQNANDAKIALAKKYAADFNRLLKSHNPVTLAAGMRFAQEHPGLDLASALLFHAAQVQTATPVVK